MYELYILEVLFIRFRGDRRRRVEPAISEVLSSLWRLTAHPVLSCARTSTNILLDAVIRQCHLALK